MNRKTIISLHVAVWAILFLAPLSFMRGSGFPFMQFLMSCVSPLLMMVVFYANYLWLTPHYFVTGNHRFYWFVNVIMVVCLGILLHYWMSYVRNLFDPDPSRRMELTVLNVLFFILRDIFNLAVAAAVATAIVLATHWQHNEEARLEAEAARADAELKNLRSQINPHFLLNTLNNIYALTAIDQSRAQDAIQQLSKMLRHMLYDNQQEDVALKDEIQFLENYVNLMKIRLSKDVDVQFTTAVQNSSLRVAPLMFISLVENAFKHGVSPTEPGFIHITVRTETEAAGLQGSQTILVCSISNSNHPKTSQDRSGHGIGLSQVQRRLDLAYPGRYVWTKGVSEDGKTYTSEIKLKI